MRIHDLSGYESLEEIWEDHKYQMDQRKIHYLRHLPIGGRYREIGCHQGLGALQALMGRKASFLDLYDVADNGYSQIAPYFADYNVHYTRTNGSPKLETKDEVDVTWIDACKRGAWVYEALKENAPLTKLAIGVDDTVSSPDIIKGVNKFLEEDKDWVLESVMYVYPGLAVLTRRSYVQVVPGQGN